MLSRRYRLKKEGFRNVFRKGVYVKGRFISLKKTENNLSHIRAGFVVGQKIAKKAAERNRIKRILRETAKSYIYKAKTGMDLILLPSPDIKNKKSTDVKEEIEQLFKRNEWL